MEIKEFTYLLNSEDSSEETVVKRNPTKKNGMHSMGVKFGHYYGNTCIKTFLAGFENCAECRVGRLGQTISIAS